MGRPSTRRTQVLDFVRATVAEEGRAPSYEQIANALGFSTRQEVTRIVGKLEAMGRLKRAGRGRVRRIRIMPPIEAAT